MIALRKSLAVITIAGLLLAGLPTAFADAQLLESTIARIRPGVVLVVTERRQGGTTIGSGFVIQPDGFIITTRHLIEDARDIWVVPGVGQRISAALVRYSEIFDAAVLKLPGAGYRPLSFAQPAAVQLGTEVYALGHTSDRDGDRAIFTASRGVITALRLSEGRIQVDAALNAGHSGGPVVNRQGEVVGMAIVRRDNPPATGFVVPSDLLRTLMVALSATPVEPPRGSAGALAGTPRPAPTPTPLPPLSPPSGLPVGRTIVPTAGAPWNIVPSSNVGVVRLGMLPSEFVRFVGRPTGTTGIEDTIIDVYEPIGLAVGTKRASGVELIAVGTNPIDGLVLPVSLDAVRALYIGPRGLRLGDNRATAIANVGLAPVTVRNDAVTETVVFRGLELVFGTRGILIGIRVTAR